MSHESGQGTIRRGAVADVANAAAENGGDTQGEKGSGEAA